MDRDLLLAKKEELEKELAELNTRKHWTPEEESRIHLIKKMKLRIKDLLDKHF